MVSEEKFRGREGTPVNIRVLSMSVDERNLLSRNNHEKPLSVYSYDHAYILTIVEEVVPCLNSSPMRCGHPMLPVQV